MSALDRSRPLNATKRTVGKVPEERVVRCRLLRIGNLSFVYASCRIRRLSLPRLRTIGAFGASGSIYRKGTNIRSHDCHLRRCRVDSSADAHASDCLYLDGCAADSRSATIDQALIRGLVTALPVSVAGPILRLSSGVGRTCPTVHRGLPITIGCPRHASQGHTADALAPPLVVAAGKSVGLRRRHPACDIPGIAIANTSSSMPTVLRNDDRVEGGSCGQSVWLRSHRPAHYAGRGSGHAPPHVPHPVPRSPSVPQPATGVLTSSHFADPSLRGRPAASASSTVQSRCTAA